MEEEQQGSMAAAVGKAEQGSRPDFHAPHPSLPAAFHRSREASSPLNYILTPFVPADLPAVPFNGEVLLSEEEQRVIRRLPRRDKALWQVVVRPLRAWSASSQSPADGEAIPVRPRCVFVNELYPSGASLLRDLCDPPEREPAPRALLDRILSVMREPPEGLAQCRPAAVVLPDARVVAALGSSLAAVGVACAQLSESDGLQPLVREFSSFLVRKDIAAAGPSADHAGALSGTHVLPSLLYCFHRAAAAYRRLEPWRRLPPGAAFQLTVPHSRSVHVDDMPFRRASQGSIKARDTEIGEGRVDADAVGSGGGGSGDGHGVSAAATPEMVLRAPEGTVWVSIMGAPDPTPAEAARRASERAGTATEGEGTMQDRSPASPAGLALFFGQPALYERMLPGLVPARDPHACCAHTGAFAAEGSLPDEGGESLIPSLRQRGQGATPEAAAGSLSAPEEGGAGTGAAFPLPPSSGLQRCARCRAAYYRAAGDQRAHWRAHKRHCAESVRRFSPGGKPLGKGERAGVTWPDREVSVLFEPLTQVPFDDLDAAERCVCERV